MKRKYGKRPAVLMLTFLLTAGTFAFGDISVLTWAAGETESVPADPLSADLSEKVAGAGEMTDVLEVEEDGMVPVPAEELKDGTYEVEMKSSSSMFRIDHALLDVENGEMRVSLYMTSKSYLYMFAGTAAQAAAAGEADYIPLTAAEDDMGIFVLPLEALDKGLPFAAFSRKKEKWYDRTLLFRADSLPADAFKTSRYTLPADLGLADGIYTAEVTLEGGSGRAAVESPAELTISGDTCTARIIWGSPNYDYMVVEGERYDPVNTEGNSEFLIPVAGFDGRLPVQADTTAMSQPYLIDYTLCFDSSTLVPVP